MAATSAVLLNLALVLTVSVLAAAPVAALPDDPTSCVEHHPLPIGGPTPMPQPVKDTVADLTDPVHDTLDCLTS